MKSQSIKIFNNNKDHHHHHHHNQHHHTTDNNRHNQKHTQTSLLPLKTAKTRLIIIATFLGLILICLMAARPTFGLPTQVQQQQQQRNSQQPGQLQSQSESPKGVYKRSFAGLGCLGVYDKGKFARLDRVCEECYQLYREPDIHQACR